MIKYVIFDLDNTLIDRNQTFNLFIEKQFFRFSQQLGIEFADYQNYIMENDNSGYTKKYDLYSGLCEKFKIDQSLVDLLLLDLRNFYGKEPILFKDVVEVLSELGKKYTLAILSNGRSSTQRSKIDVTNISKYFSEIIISEEVGIEKPDPEIYKLCLKNLSALASECVYVGDHPINDVDIPLQLGMKVIWMSNDNFKLIPDRYDAICHDLKDLLFKIENL